MIDKRALREYDTPVKAMASDSGRHCLFYAFRDRQAPKTARRGACPHAPEQGNEACQPSMLHPATVPAVGVDSIRPNAGLFKRADVGIRPYGLPLLQHAL